MNSMVHEKMEAWNSSINSFVLNVWFHRFFFCTCLSLLFLVFIETNHINRHVIRQCVNRGWVMARCVETTRTTPVLGCTEAKSWMMCARFFLGTDQNFLHRWSFAGRSMANQKCPPFWQPISNSATNPRGLRTLLKWVCFLHCQNHCPWCPEDKKITFSKKKQLFVFLFGFQVQRCRQRPMGLLTLQLDPGQWYQLSHPADRWDATLILVHSNLRLSNPRLPPPNRLLSVHEVPLHQATNSEFESRRHVLQVHQGHQFGHTALVLWPGRKVSHTTHRICRDGRQTSAHLFFVRGR